MFHFGRRIIRVTFVDDGTGKVISTSRMPLERLPDTFASDSELKMAGHTYLVLRADPPTKEVFSGTGRLEVFLRKRVF